MHEPETRADRDARLSRFVNDLIRQAEKGAAVEWLRRYLEAAIKMSPLTSDESAKLLSNFDSGILVVQGQRPE